MSQAAKSQVAKLERLLARVQKNRAAPRMARAIGAAPRAAREEHSEPELELGEASGEVSFDERELDLVPVAPTPAPTPSPAPVSRGARPTPMEQALEMTSPPSEEPELEILVGDDDDEEGDDDDAILMLDGEDSVPTAPIDTPAVRGAALPAPAARSAPAAARARPAPAASSAAPSIADAAAAATASAGGPERLALAASPAASAPIGRVTSTPRPTTFGQLLQRTLALRPR